MVPCFSNIQTFKRYFCRYVDRIADKLKRQLALTKKYESTIGTHQNTIKSSQLEEASLRPKVAFLIEESKEWQKLVRKKTCWT